MRACLKTKTESPANAPHRQAVRLWATLAIVMGLLFVHDPAAVQGQLYDSLDAHPPRWYLDSSDCDARVLSQDHLVGGGIDGGACETIKFTCGNGTEVLLAYPIEPVRPLDDLTANVSVMSARSGSRVGFRVRFPYLRDAETRAPAAVVVYGSAYDRAGAYASIGVGMIERALRLKMVAVRREHGPDADLTDPYIDGVVINAYSGPGTTSLRVDELRVDGLIPAGEGVVTGDSPGTMLPGGGTVAGSTRLEDANQMRRLDPETPRLQQRAPFPLGRVTRILEYNGEPLAWVRSLGFDAILTSKPVDAEILREAISARVMIYSPPPSAPDPQLQSLLDPVAGWYLGSGKALDGRHLDDIALTSRRLRGWPSRWRRPLIAAPAEKWRSYASLVDAIIDDLPMRNRGLSGAEEVAQMIETRRQVGDRVTTAVGISSMPPEAMLRQTEAIAALIGAPEPESFRWHSMWLQVMRSLESSPSAILFRSSRSLASGRPMAAQRAMALSYVNRMVAMIAPWLASSSAAPAPAVVAAPYRCSRLRGGATDLLILTSVATRGSEILAGDGEVVEILLSPEEANRTVWRLTHFSAERLTPETTASGSRVQIVSPDAAEILVISSDASMGARLSQSATRFARQAGLDRWQLAGDLVRRTSQNWVAASATQISDRAPPTSLINVAQRTLEDAEPLYRAGDVDASLRMARRADAWALRSEWQLSEAIMPDWPRPTSCPPVDFGAAEIQTAWRALMDNEGWGDNRMTTGGLDRPLLLSQWNFGQRMPHRVESEVRFASRGMYQGTGALRAVVSSLADDALPGGYEGTVIQIRSPAVRVNAGTAIRIDVMVRTLGFGRPHQGVLVYDSIGGQEMGVLVRGRADWTPVRLYRQAMADGEVEVMFELIGAGEATIDDVQLRIWEPSAAPPRPFLRPISHRTASRHDPSVESAEANLTADESTEESLSEVQSAPESTKR